MFIESAKKVVGRAHTLFRRFYLVAKSLVHCSEGRKGQNIK